MKAAIFTKQFDPLGDRLLAVNAGRSRLGDVSRRKTRVKTLDGGYAIEDRGFSAADRSIQLAFPASKAERDYLKYLVSTYSYCYICIDGALYYVSISRLAESFDLATLYVDVQEQY